MVIVSQICFDPYCWLFTDWGMHGQPPPPPPEQAWIPPGQVAMDVINPSEDSNSQDSLEFPGEPHHRGFPSNNHGFGGQPEPYPITPMAVNQFDYQVCNSLFITSVFLTHIFTNQSYCFILAWCCTNRDSIWTALHRVSRTILARQNSEQNRPSSCLQNRTPPIPQPVGNKTRVAYTWWAQKLIRMTWMQSWCTILNKCLHCLVSCSRCC